MKTIALSNGRSRTFSSVFFQSSLIIAICTVLVTVSQAYMSYLAFQKSAETSVQDQASEVTSLIAQQSGGALKFGKLEVFERLLMDTIEESDGAALAGAVYQMDGTQLVVHGDAAALGADVAPLVAKAIETNASARSLDGFTAVFPVRFGKENAAIGALAMQWTADVLHAKNMQTQMMTLAISGLIGLAALIGAATVLRTRLSRPLVDLRDVMAQVADQDFSAKVPGLTRSDEVGAIARTLEDFRSQLSDAAETSRESVFKGSAFEGSNAAMMIVDADFGVQYLNAACQTLLTDFRHYFETVDGAFDPELVVGATIDSWLDPDGALRTTIANPTNLPHHCDIVAGEQRIHLTVSAVIDTAGTQTGCVLEMKDVTADQLNKAAIAAIDTNQIRLEANVTGALLAVNDNFAQAMGQSSATLEGRAFDTLFRRHESSQDPGVDLEAVRQGKALTGRFVTQGTQGEVIIEGSINLVNDMAGQPWRIVFIGTDVTTARQAIEKSRLLQKANERAQADVVTVLRDVLGRLADGDLSATIDQSFNADYETLRVDYNAAVQKLSEAMIGVVGNADQIEQETAQIANANEDLAKRTENQAATLQETAAALDSMTTDVQSAAEGAAQVAGLVETTRKHANASTDVMRNTQTAMSEIESSSEKISKITDVIEAIAFQTNLLALNAGVEAARAGEAGRGFTVVATEVRALAQRSSEAAGEINDLLSVSNEQVVRGVDLVKNASTALQEIVDGVRDISDKVTDIAGSSRRQSEGLAEINLSVARLDQVTQHNVAMFEETSAAGQTLDQEAKALLGNIARFNIAKTVPKIAASENHTYNPAPQAEHTAKSA